MISRLASRRPLVGTLAFVSFGLLGAVSAGAQPIPFSTTHSEQYLLIGTGPANSSGGQPGVGQAVNVNNFELGANKAPVPSTSGFLSGGSSGGPGLLGNVPNIPLIAKPVGSGIFGNGNVAITHPGGVFNLQDVGVYANLGIRAQGSSADVGTSNSFWNDPNQFPNTFTSTGLTNPLVNNNTGGFGTDVNPNNAVQSTRIDNPRRAGVFGGFNHAPLRAELAAARVALNGLASTGSLNVLGGVQNTQRVVNVNSGINVIDIVTGGNDFSLNNANLIINGPADAVAIFRVPDSIKFLVSNGNILIGNGGIGDDSVLFYTDREDNAAHFAFSNSVLHGVSFWSLGLRGGEINSQNSQGCTQFVADKINLSDVRYGRCSFGFSVIPEPTTAGAIVALMSLTALRRRSRRVI